MTDSGATPAATPAEAIATAARLASSGSLAAARALLVNLTGSIDACLLLSQVAQRQGDFAEMLQAAENAVALDPAHWSSRFRHLECLLYCGHAERLRASLPGYEDDAAHDPRLLARVAEFYVHCLDHAGAKRCLDSALRTDPNNPDHLFSRSASEVALGELVAAERTLDRVIELRPDDGDAWRNRSTLRRRSADDNTLDGIRKQLKSVQQGTANEVQLRYALAKELEDLGDYTASFAELQRGADARRGLLSYRVEHDIAIMRQLQESFTPDLVAASRTGFRQFGPVFVLGLPRSGTTLVDRILSSHPRVASLGEVNDFAFSLMHVLGVNGSKSELVRLSASMDFTALGRRYWEGVCNYGVQAPMLIDKTPLNYLYIGLLRLALPEARVIHVRRAPLDSCYGMYRTLFRAGYPFSYDLQDLATYYIEWHRLMEHWQRVCGDWLYEVPYESLVADQEGKTRSLLTHCDLDWDDACLRFYENRAAVATASSAQVRRPVYRDALERWRHYERQLQPLLERLDAAGIPVDGRP